MSPPGTVRRPRPYNRSPSPPAQDGGAVFAFPRVQPSPPMIAVTDNFWHRTELENRHRSRRQVHWWIAAVATHLALAAVFLITLSRPDVPRLDAASIEMVSPPAPPHIDPPPKPIAATETPKPRVIVRHAVPKPVPRLAPVPLAAPPLATTPRQDPPPPPPPAQASPPPDYVSRLYAHLDANKRYPRAAQMAHVQGIALLRFKIDHAGRVLAFSLERGSGHSELDSEVLAMIQRAQPVPAPPAGMPDPWELIIPVKFGIK